MRTKHLLTLAEVDEILSAARNEAFKHNWVVTIAVVDDGGHLLGLSRLDGASPLSASIAIEKARTSAIRGRESKAFEGMINGGRFAFSEYPAPGHSRRRSTHYVRWPVRRRGGRLRG